MTFMPARAGTEPVWNSDTDEVVVTVEGAGVAVVVPPQCTYMVFTVSDLSSGDGGIFISPDSGDRNSGMVLEDGPGGIRNLGIPVVPGSTLYLGSPALSEGVINITRFYTKK